MSRPHISVRLWWCFFGEEIKNADKTKKWLFKNLDSHFLFYFFIYFFVLLAISINTRHISAIKRAITIIKKPKIGNNTTQHQ